DLDPDNLPGARERLAATGLPFTLHQGNFAGLPNFLGEAGLAGADVLLADLGMSSMQVDDARRRFSYARHRPPDLRTDRSGGRTAAEVLATISEEELRQALSQLGDEPEAFRLAKAIVRARQEQPIERTADLARVLLEATQPAGKGWRLHPAPGRWNLHPA